MNESYTNDDFPECRERKVKYIQNINGQNKYNKKRPKSSIMKKKKPYIIGCNDA
jgi:hypothetical protein